MSDGAFRRDGSFRPAPTHDLSVLESAWQHAVLAWFVEAEWLDPDAAAGMLAWPHSGFGVHVGPAIAGDDRDALLRVARYSARAPVAESRLRYDAGRAEVELVSDRSDGPYAGTHRFSALEFIARWVDHVPDRYETRVRYYGAYATRRRVWWQRRGISRWRARLRRRACRLRPLPTGLRCVLAGGAGPSCCGSCARSRSRCAPAAVGSACRGSLRPGACMTQEDVCSDLATEGSERGDPKAGWGDP